jgi:hypothetical protein
MENKEIILGLVAFSVVFLSAMLMVVFAILHGKKATSRRVIPAIDRMKQAVGRLVEDGSRLHISLGRGGLLTPQSASALAGLSLLQRLSRLTSASDKPPIATSGEACLAFLSQDSLRKTAANTGQVGMDLHAGRLTGMTPFSYAAGVIPAIHDEKVSATILMGNFGMEAGLIAEAAERENSFSLAGSDNLTAQAVLYTTARETLVGEEMFAAGAYADPSPVQNASLTVQDILRWLTILVILGWSLLKVMGVL